MSASEVSLFWHGYRYFQYEKALAFRELKTIANPITTAEFADGKGVRIKTSANCRDLDRLVYFESYQSPQKTDTTLQGRLERGCPVTGGTRRQSTRYSAHGLHEYKGKFNPQIARAILNILSVEASDRVLDPFCGSGTTLLECTHGGINSVGTDINPLAVRIANEKQGLLRIPGKMLSQQLDECLAEYSRQGDHIQEEFWQVGSLNYLKSWFELSHLADFDRLRRAIATCEPEVRGALTIMASDLIRDYSLQEPADLRIRRRKSPYPATAMIEVFEAKGRRLISNLEHTERTLRRSAVHGKANLEDCRKYSAGFIAGHNKKFSAVITSPPYATALPYIDTQRLSLIWLLMTDPKGIQDLDHLLTGSREMKKFQLLHWKDALAKNSSSLPKEAHNFCMQLTVQLSEEDGFRRQAVPALIYRYLADMKDMFGSVRHIVGAGTPFALVVGTNRTTLGGMTTIIDTPRLLSVVASDMGWVESDQIPLDTYHRFGLHASNAVASETLLLLEAHA